MSITVLQAQHIFVGDTARINGEWLDVVDAVTGEKGTLLEAADRVGRKGAYLLANEYPLEVLTP